MCFTYVFQGLLIRDGSVNGCCERFSASRAQERLPSMFYFDLFVVVFYPSLANRQVIPNPFFTHG